MAAQLERKAPGAGHGEQSAFPLLYVAGDVHLDGSAGAFAPFLDILLGRPAARLVILGDLFDYWVESPAVARRHDGVLERLRRLNGRGWRLDLVCGNRELVAGRRLEVASASTLHWPSLDLTLGGRRLRVVHGDRLCYDPGYRFYAAWMRSFFWRAFAACFPPLVHEGIARWLRAASQAGQERRRRESARRTRVFIDRRRVQGAARGADTLIAGHIHQAWRRRIGGVDMILVGDWPASRGHWVEGYADGRLVHIERDFGQG